MMTRQSRLALAAIAEEGVTLAEVKVAYIAAVLARCGGNKAAAMRVLDVSRPGILNHADEIEAYNAAARNHDEVAASYNWAPIANGTAAVGHQRKGVAAC